MSKVMGPLMSLSASQTFAGAITYSRSRGQNVVRLKSNPSNPKTIGQMKGRAYFGAGGKISKVADPQGTEATFLKTKTPVTLTWANYLIRNMLGTNNATIEASKTAYELGGNSVAAGYFDTVAATAGIESIDLDGTANTQVPAGLSLWAAYGASFSVGSANATTAPKDADLAKVKAYASALTGQVIA